MADAPGQVRTPQAGQTGANIGSGSKFLGKKVRAKLLADTAELTARPQGTVTETQRKNAGVDGELPPGTNAAHSEKGVLKTAQAANLKRAVRQVVDGGVGTSAVPAATTQTAAKPQLSQVTKPTTTQLAATPAPHTMKNPGYAMTVGPRQPATGEWKPGGILKNAGVRTGSPFSYRPVVGSAASPTYRLAPKPTQATQVAQQSQKMPMGAKMMGAGMGASMLLGAASMGGADIPDAAMVASMGLMGVGSMSQLLGGSMKKLGKGLTNANPALSKVAPAAKSLVSRGMVPAAKAFGTVAPLLTNPYVAAAAAIAAVVGGVVLAFKGMQAAAAESGENLGRIAIKTDEFSDGLSEAYGTESLFDKRSKRLEAKRSGVSVADLTQAEQIGESDFGKKMSEDFATGVGAWGASTASDMFAQDLSSAVLDGVINKKQAQAFANEVAGPVQGAAVASELSNIIGKGGKLIASNPAKVALKTLKSDLEVASRATAEAELANRGISNPTYYDPTKIAEGVGTMWSAAQGGEGDGFVENAKSFFGGMLNTAPGGQKLKEFSDSSNAQTEAVAQASTIWGGAIRRAYMNRTSAEERLKMMRDSRGDARKAQSAAKKEFGEDSKEYEKATKLVGEYDDAITKTAVSQDKLDQKTRDVVDSSLAAFRKLNEGAEHKGDQLLETAKTNAKLLANDPAQEAMMNEAFTMMDISGAAKDFQYEVTQAFQSGLDPSLISNNASLFGADSLERVTRNQLGGLNIGEVNELQAGLVGLKDNYQDFASLSSAVGSADEAQIGNVAAKVQEIAAMDADIRKSVSFDTDLSDLEKINKVYDNLDSKGDKKILVDFVTGGGDIDQFREYTELLDKQDGNPKDILVDFIVLGSEGLKEAEKSVETIKDKTANWKLPKLDSGEIDADAVKAKIDKIKAAIKSVTDEKFSVKFNEDAGEIEIKPKVTDPLTEGDVIDEGAKNPEITPKVNPTLLDSGLRGFTDRMKNLGTLPEPKKLAPQTTVVNAKAGNTVSKRDLAPKSVSTKVNVNTGDAAGKIARLKARAKKPVSAKFKMTANGLGNIVSKKKSLKTPVNSKLKITSNADEVKAKKNALKSPTQSKHSINDNASTAASHISALQGKNTNSTHTITVKKVGPNATGGPITKLKAGGFVSGEGGPTDDKIPAMLSNGEYVIRAKAVDKYGQAFLSRVNRMHYAGGGSVNRKKGESKKEFKERKARIGAQKANYQNKVSGIQTFTAPKRGSEKDEFKWGKDFTDGFNKTAAAQKAGQKVAGKWFKNNGKGGEAAWSQLLGSGDSRAFKQFNSLSAKNKKKFEKKAKRTESDEYKNSLRQEGIDAKLKLGREKKMVGFKTELSGGLTKYRQEIMDLSDGEVKSLRSMSASEQKAYLEKKKKIQSDNAYMKVMADEKAKGQAIDARSGFQDTYQGQGFSSQIAGLSDEEAIAMRGMSTGEVDQILRKRRQKVAREMEASANLELTQAKDKLGFIDTQGSLSKYSAEIAGLTAEEMEAMASWDLKRKEAHLKEIAQAKAATEAINVIVRKGEMTKASYTDAIVGASKLNALGFLGVAYDKKKLQQREILNGLSSDEYRSYLTMTLAQQIAFINAEQIAKENEEASKKMLDAGKLFVDSNEAASKLFTQRKDMDGKTADVQKVLAELSAEEYELYLMMNATKQEEFVNQKKLAEGLKKQMKQFTDPIGFMQDKTKAFIDKEILNQEGQSKELQEATIAQQEWDIDQKKKSIEKINEAYDDQAKAAADIEKHQNQIASIEKGRLGIAQALSQGDIAGAAAAMKAAKAEEASISRQQMQDAIQKERDSRIERRQDEIDDIEDSIWDIQNRMKRIEVEANLAAAKLIESIRAAEINSQWNIYSGGLGDFTIPSAPDGMVSAKSAQFVNAGVYNVTVNAQTSSDADEITSMVVAELQTMMTQNVRGS